MPETLLIIPGVARSKTARSAHAYEEQVSEVARRSFKTPLRERNLSVEVHHFYTSGHTVDLDNLLKCILDGLKRGAYEDDSQVVRVLAERYNVSGSFAMENPRPEWIEYLPPWSEPRDFVSVIVSRRD